MCIRESGGPSLLGLTWTSCAVEREWLAAGHKFADRLDHAELGVPLIATPATPRRDAAMLKDFPGTPTSKARQQHRAENATLSGVLRSSIRVQADAPIPHGI